MTVLEQFANVDRITMNTGLAVSWSAAGWRITDPDVLFAIPSADDDQLAVEDLAATVEPVAAPIPLWSVVCAACSVRSRPCELISLALDEWQDHIRTHLGA